MKPEEIETRMKFYGNRKNPRNVKEAKFSCTFCGKESWQTYLRVLGYVKEGKNIFCSPKCTNKYRASLVEPQHIGKENAGFTWDTKRENWYAYWFEEGKQRSTTKAHWLWEMYRGDVPKGYWVNFIDGDKSNCELENLKLISRGERMSVALMGHQLSEETKEKISFAHKGKILSEEHKISIGIATQKRWDDGDYDNVHIGENNHHWRGGQRGQYSREFRKVRKIVLQRDKNKCRICGTKEKLHIHHINRNTTDNREINLIAVCVWCHNKIHDTTPTDDPEISAFRSMLGSGEDFLILY